MKKRITSMLLAAIMIMTLAIPAFAFENSNSYVTRFGVNIPEDNYSILLSQGLSEEDIDYLNESEYRQYLTEAGGELITKVETYYICKKDGTNVAVPQVRAERIANCVNLGIMPLEDDAGYDFANDGICKLVLMLYKTGFTFRSTATVTWLSEPPTNAQDILGIVHNEGLITDGDDVTTTMWYDWSNDGVTYTTATKKAESIDLKVGCGVSCKFERDVTSPKYNVACKNFRYRVEMRSQRNNTSGGIMVQADYYRGINKLTLSPSVNMITVIGNLINGKPVLAAISLLPKYESSFANVLQADIMYTL